LPGPTDDYFAYKRWFDREYDALELPADCSEPSPPLSYSNQYTWTVEWYLVFANDPKVYIRVFEHFAKRAQLQLSQRIHFAYNYAPITRSDPRGVPGYLPNDPIFVRIDNIHRPPHLHPEADPTQHHLQEKIDGLTLANLDLFDFVRASLRHRQSGRPMSRELGYRII